MTILSPSFAAAEVELIYRSQVDVADRPIINTSADAFKVLLNAWDKNKIEFVEQFSILLLNDANHCLGYSCIHTGGISKCPVDFRIAFATALKANATSIIIAHNHPSGEVIPSASDLYVTQTFVDVGDIMTIPVKDHLIITPAKFYSLADQGVLR